MAFGEKTTGFLVLAGANISWENPFKTRFSMDKLTDALEIGIGDRGTENRFFTECKEMLQKYRASIKPKCKVV